MVAFFNLATCPSGWSSLVTAEGRYMVGKPLGGNLAGTVGTVLTNMENRAVGQHNHGVSDPGHSHPYGSSVWHGGGPYPKSNNDYPYLDGGTGGAVTGISVNNAGSVAGTNAPYIQFLVCVKN
jgi:hypothetical protein